VSTRNRQAWSRSPSLRNSPDSSGRSPRLNNPPTPTGARGTLPGRGRAPRKATTVARWSRDKYRQPTRPTTPAPRRHAATNTWSASYHKAKIYERTCDVEPVEKSSEEAPGSSSPRSPPRYAARPARRTLDALVSGTTRCSPTRPKARYARRSPRSEKHSKAASPAIARCSSGR
jgi:hypothetical protein